MDNTYVTLWLVTLVTLPTTMLQVYKTTKKHCERKRRSHMWYCGWPMSPMSPPQCHTTVGATHHNLNWASISIFMEIEEHDFMFCLDWIIMCFWLGRVNATPVKHSLLLSLSYLLFTLLLHATSSPWNTPSVTN